MEVKPTESELEILQVLWKKKAGTVREVNEQLSKNRESEIGYTTTLKLMQIMFEKGLVARDSSARTHVYTAKVTEESTRSNIIEKLISNVFNGSASQLVMHAIRSNKSSKEEIELIKKYLDQQVKND